jgi:hypothetical protein
MMVDTRGFLACTNDDKVIFFFISKVIYISDLESELDASMGEVFRLISDC